MLYPLNTISCIYIVIIRIGRFSLSGYWLILAWLAFDIWGALRGGGRIAYAAHVGGFAAGFAVAAAAVWLGRLRMEAYEKSLLEVLGIRPMADRPEPRSREGIAERAEPRPAQAHGPDLPAQDDGPPIVLHCPCGKVLRAPARFAGKTIRCPVCTGPILVRDGPSRHR